MPEILKAVFGANNALWNKRMMIYKTKPKARYILEKSYIVFADSAKK